MANGEIVFEAPWQSRVFGMARAMCEQGVFAWDDFREQLIVQIEKAESADYQYFDHFLAALTALLAEKQLCSADELDDVYNQYAARPHGHDHAH